MPVVPRFNDGISGRGLYIGNRTRRMGQRRAVSDGKVARWWRPARDGVTGHQWLWSSEGWSCISAWGGEWSKAGRWDEAHKSSALSLDGDDLVLLAKKAVI